MGKKSYVAILAAIIIFASAMFLLPREVEGDNDAEMDVPDTSSTVINLPWINNSKFLKAQKINDTPILIAAFCTVLSNPTAEEESNVHLAASSVCGIVIQANEIFSQNKSIGPYDEEKGYKAGQSYVGSEVRPSVGGGVCKIASTLYNVATYSNLEIVERHNHFMPVSYIPYGQDATVSYGSKDLSFKNNTEFPILIWAKGIENRVYIGLYGKEKAPLVEWNHKVLNKIKAPVIYKINTDLAEGEERILVEGMDGLSVESWVTITTPDGKTTSKNMGISQYWPMPYEIERSG